MVQTVASKMYPNDVASKCTRAKHFKTLKTVPLQQVLYILASQSLYSPMRTQKHADRQSDSQGESNTSHTGTHVIPNGVLTPSVNEQLNLISDT